MNKNPNKETQFKKGHPPTLGSFKKGHKFGLNTRFQKGNKIWDNENNNKSRFEKGHKPYKICGEKNPSWQGGISFEPYSVDWTETLKRAIRERAHYICQICNKSGYPVHHIDYNKKNCNPENLITLCFSCHSIVNFNRNYWTNCFKIKVGAEQKLLQTSIK